jgi:hypothetical protein
MLTPGQQHPHHHRPTPPKPAIATRHSRDAAMGVLIGRGWPRWHDSTWAKSFVGVAPQGMFHRNGPPEKAILPDGASHTDSYSTHSR